MSRTGREESTAQPYFRGLGGVGTKVESLVVLWHLPTPCPIVLLLHWLAAFGLSQARDGVGVYRTRVKQKSRNQE